MVKQRQGWRRDIPEPYASRIKNNQCPNCALPEDKWKRRTDWTCCSKKCSDEYYGSWEFKGIVVMSWGEVRNKAFIRDNYTCVKCGEEHIDDNLIGDHIKPIALGGEEFNVDNVQTLCKPCDKKKTAIDIKEIAKLRAIERKQEGNQLLVGV